MTEITARTFRVAKPRVSWGSFPGANRPDWGLLVPDDPQLHRHH
jgi:hypothetical protein